ncbi:MAG: anhydro-N-acetylmuramic acid kinase [Verrucomicrobiales bacterium]|nr:anhydro-N-acetylmuramic acid kinase [Verrucomicrobiales bacterium]
MRLPGTVLGLMSGTSLDGVDGVVVQFDRGRMRLVEVWSFPYPKSLRRRLLACASNEAGTWQTARLHHELGRFYAECVIERMAGRRVEAVGLHGQTVFHQGPPGEPATLQLGEPAYLARALRVPVVGNFRARDLAEGGQGAPLATLFHVKVFGRRSRHVCVQNLGGIGNVTSIDGRKGGRTVVKAFDTGPANLLLDQAVQWLTDGRRAYDRNGALAAKGTVSEDLVVRWLRHRFFHLRPPKSTGREMFGAPYLERLWSDMDRRRLDAFDRLATLTELTARSVALNYREHLDSKPDDVVLCGGGARNPAMVRALERVLGEEFAGIRLTTCEEVGWPVHAVEGAAFALLARECLAGRPGNLHETTGARAAVRCGQITFP